MNFTELNLYAHIISGFLALSCGAVAIFTKKKVKEFMLKPDRSTSGQ